MKFTQGCCQSFFILYNMRQPHKGGCYGTPSQCNLLQIQSAQLPTSRPCHLQVLRLPRFFFTSPVQGCDLYGPANATHMQHTRNTYATQAFSQAKWLRGPKWTFSILIHSKTGVGGQILHVDCKFTGEKLMLHFVSHVCCMCVACALHSRCVG